MNLTKYLNKSGEHPFLTQGKAGQIEGILSVPENARGDFLAVLGHPHSLQGGTMNNKVVTTLARVFKALSVPSIRFNFRGVGGSEGEYDAGIGESDDILSLVEQWHKSRPSTKYLFAGFSFGSYVAFRAAAKHPHELLITIAPPVHHYDYESTNSSMPSPWIIVQGDEDEVVPLQVVVDFAKAHQPSLPILHVQETGHFFHGKLVELKSRLIDEIRSSVSSL